MTPTDPPSGRALSDEQAETILVNLNLRDERDGYKAAAELLQAEVIRVAAEHADCSNLSHVEASRIFEEARQMRAERDAAIARADAVATNAVDTLMGQCTAPGRHGIERMSFSAFCATEGVRCSLCIAAERDAAREALAALREAGDALKRLLRGHLDEDEQYADYGSDLSEETERALEARIAEQQNAITGWDRALAAARPDEPKAEGGE